MDTPKRMSDKQFLAKFRTKAVHSVAGFLAAHREWLLSHECADKIAPILNGISAKEILPTPGINDIKMVILSHHVAKTIAKAERIQQYAAKKSSKPVMATILDGKGEVATRKDEKTGEDVELCKGFDNLQEARNWIDNRLVNDGHSDWSGELTHTLLQVKGEPYFEEISREESFGRIYKRNKSPISKHQKSSSKLSWGMKVSESHCNFSRG